MDIWATVCYLPRKIQFSNETPKWLLLQRATFTIQISFMVIDSWVGLHTAIKAGGQVWIKPRLVVVRLQSTIIISESNRKQTNFPTNFFQLPSCCSSSIISHPFPDLLKLTGSRPTTSTSSSLNLPFIANWMTLFTSLWNYSHEGSDHLKQLFAAGVSLVNWTSLFSILFFAS